MTAPKNVAPGVGGTWLYKQGELVLGPLPGEQLVAKLYDGELDGRTLVTRKGENQFLPIASQPAFKLELAKAEAKQRVDAAARAEQAERAKKRTLVITSVAVATLIVGSAGAYLGIKGAVHSGGAEEDDFGISISMPKIGLARAGAGEELLEYPGGPKNPSRPSGSATSSTPSRPKPAAPETGAKAPPKPSGAVAAKAPKTHTEADGLEMAEFDREAINAVVASQKKTLIPCLQAEARKGLTGTVPIEFVIGNDGRVSKVWIDHPQGKSGSLPECMLSALKRWPFKPYPGEQATVGLSFNIGGKG